MIAGPAWTLEGRTFVAATGAASTGAQSVARGIRPPQDDRDRASERRVDAGSAHITAIPKALFAVARRALAVVQVHAFSNSAVGRRARQAGLDSTLRAAVRIKRPCRRVSVPHMYLRSAKQNLRERRLP